MPGTTEEKVYIKVLEGFNIEIVKYNAKALQSFIESDLFSKLKNIPISYQRAESHIKNPRLDKEDIILFVAFLNNEVIGYRTVMADFHITKSGEKIKFGWLSGVWVDPMYRRIGLARKLFEIVDNDWNGMLMYTNYAPASKKVYDSTNRFKLYATKEGARYYIRFSFKLLLESRHPFFKKISFLLGSIDYVLNIFNDLRLRFIKNRFINCKLNPVNDNLIDEFYEHAEKKKELFFSGRGKEEFSWIINNPWVLQNKIRGTNYSNYHFSSVSKDYRFSVLQFITDKGGLKNYLAISMKDGNVHVAYVFSDDYDKAAQQVVVFALKHRASMITVYNKELLKALDKYTRFRILKRSMERNYFVTNKLFEKLPLASDKKMADGEGDVVFV